MTIADAAEALAVSPRTVRRLIDQGALSDPDSPADPHPSGRSGMTT